MYGRTGLDRFKKAQSLDPFSVTANPTAPKAAKQTTVPPPVALPPPQFKVPQQQNQASQKPVGQDVGAGVVQTQNRTQVGGGQSTWQPPDWAIEPRPGFYYLEVLKDGEAIDRVNLDKRRTIFGRQFHTCDFVLDHQSVSRQHAAVVPHKNGSIFVIDLGSAHGTFVANERLTKDSPVELEPGQSLRFAASTRIYLLRKDNAVLFPPAPLPAEINLPPSPDPTDEEAVVSYNTFLNRYGLTKSNKRSASSMAGNSSNGTGDHNKSTGRTAKRIKKLKVAFRDQVGGDLVEVVGISDGADVETEPGPLGVKEGSLVGKYESLVQTTVIPKGKELFSMKESVVTSKGVTDKLQEVLNKVKNPPKGGMYDDLFGSSQSGNVGSSWAFSAAPTEKQASSTKDGEVKQSAVPSTAKAGSNSGSAYDESDDDLFGD